jgi:glycerophosphoryl diester phosphodiesterase
MSTRRNAWLTLLVAGVSSAGVLMAMRAAHAGLQPVTAVPAAVAAAPAKPSSTIPACLPAPPVIAHRGGTESHLENTLDAFRSSGQAGVRTWETDVHFDLRGTPVILHDGTVDRVSPRSGRIDRLDATTHRIPTDDGQFIPTLHEVLSLAARFGAHVLVELKTQPTPRQWTAVRADIDQTVGPSGVTLMSFDATVVRQAHRRFPDIVTGLLGQGPPAPASAVLASASVYLREHSALATRQVRQWHSAGLQVYAWTVDDPTAWARLADMPVDAVITDRPIAYAAWRNRHCAP